MSIFYTLPHPTYRCGDTVFIVNSQRFLAYLQAYAHREKLIATTGVKHAILAHPAAR